MRKRVKHKLLILLFFSDNSQLTIPIWQIMYADDKRLTLTEWCSCVAGIILLMLIFYSCWLVCDADNKWDEKEGDADRASAVQLRGRNHFALFLIAPRSATTLLPALINVLLHCAVLLLSEKNCGRNYPTCLTFTDRMSSSEIASGEDGQH